MDYEASERFMSYLAPRETLRWAGRPQQGLMLRPSDAYMIPFSLLWCGFAIFWESLAVSGGAPLFFALWGVPFIAVGLYMVFGRFFYDAFLRSKTYYALTDRSAFILGGMKGDKLTTVDLKTLAELHLKLGSDGRGSIVFGPDNNRGFGNRYSVAPSPEFAGISDVNNVYSLIQQQRRGD